MLLAFASAVLQASPAGPMVFHTSSDSGREDADRRKGIDPLH